MQTLGRFCLFVAVYSVLELYHRFLRIFLGFLVMDCNSTTRFLAQASEIGCGFFLLGCVSSVFNVMGMILIFLFSMMILHFGRRSRGLIRFLCRFGEENPRKYVCLKNGEVRDSKVSPFKGDSIKSTQKSNEPNKSKEILTLSGSVNVNSNGDFNPKYVLEEKNDIDREVYDEDEEFDVMTLRKLVKIERQRANAAYAELEKERMAAASAADEAMAMILRLQSEKSSVVIQAKQFRRMVDQKQEYDQEVIESLRLIAMQHESQLSLLEDQLKTYREKLKQYMREDEIDQLEVTEANRGFLDFCMEEEYADDLEGFLFNSAEIDPL